MKGEPNRMSNKDEIKTAFNKVCLAISELETVKTRLADLHYIAEEAENSQEILNRLNMVLEPSSDAHEAIFTRVSRAREALRLALSGDGKQDISSRLGVAYNATSEAFKTLQ